MPSSLLGKGVGSESRAGGGHAQILASELPAVRKTCLFCVNLGLWAELYFLYLLGTVSPAWTWAFWWDWIFFICLGCSTDWWWWYNWLIMSTLSIKSWQQIWCWLLKLNTSAWLWISILEILNTIDAIEWGVSNEQLVFCKCMYQLPADTVLKPAFVRLGFWLKKNPQITQ